MAQPMSDGEGTVRDQKPGAVVAAVAKSPMAGDSFCRLLMRSSCPRLLDPYRSLKLGEPKCRRVGTRPYLQRDLVATV